MMQFFTLSFLARSAFLGALVGTILTGFYGAGGAAIAAQPQNPEALTTIKSNHWAFQSLKSLAERYSCAIDSSDLYFQPNATPSRYEMAAAVNECLNTIGHRFANPKDLETAQALQKEFKSELAILKDRSDFLKKRSEALEFNQFSTTTKFQGQAIITIQGGGFR
jgi:Carbohydrate-selective porin, OprB family